MAVQVDPRSVPRLPPPDQQRGTLGWLRHNLFRTPGDSLLTIIVVAIAAWALWQLSLWALGEARSSSSADWSGLRCRRCQCIAPGVPWYVCPAPVWWLFAK